MRPECGAWVSFSAPRYARPIGVRAVVTMAASRMNFLARLARRESDMRTVATREQRQRPAIVSAMEAYVRLPAVAGHSCRPRMRRWGQYVGRILC